MNIASLRRRGYLIDFLQTWYEGVSWWKLVSRGPSESKVKSKRSEFKGHIKWKVIFSVSTPCGKLGWTDIIYLYWLRQVLSAILGYAVTEVKVKNYGFIVLILNILFIQPNDILQMCKEGAQFMETSASRLNFQMLMVEKKRQMWPFAMNTRTNVE